MVPLSWYLIFGALLFLIGFVGVLQRRNLLIVLMSLELMLNAININFLAFGYYHQDIRGQVFALFVVVITAAEVAIALAMVIALIRNKADLKVELLRTMKG